MEPIKLEGSTCIRQAIVLSILSQRHVIIDKIRSFEDNPGINEAEKCFLDLIAKMSQGCAIKISPAGTRIVFIPGILQGGYIDHNCHLSRGISYYLEPLLALAPFSKERVRCNLYGATHVDEKHGGDPSVDALNDCCIPVLQKFGVLAELELKVNRRGTHDTGGGEVFFSCPVIKNLKSINWRDPGLIKKVRGVSYSINLSHHMVDVMVSKAKGILLNLLPDVRIDKDARSMKQTQTKTSSSSTPSSSPPQTGSGYGLVLTAISTTGCSLSSEGIGREGVGPEEEGERCAYSLLEEISDSSCVASFAQWLCLCLMPLTPIGDASFALFGPLTPSSIRFLRLMKKFTGVQFKLKEFTTVHKPIKKTKYGEEEEEEEEMGGGMGEGEGEGDEEEEEEEERSENVRIMKKRKELKEDEDDYDDNDDDDDKEDEESFSSDKKRKKNKKEQSKKKKNSKSLKEEKENDDEKSNSEGNSKEGDYEEDEDDEEEKGSKDNNDEGDGETASAVESSVYSFSDDEDEEGAQLKVTTVEVSVLGRGFPNLSRRVS